MCSGMCAATSNVGGRRPVCCVLLCEVEKIDTRELHNRTLLNTVFFC